MQRVTEIDAFPVQGGEWEQSIALTVPVTVGVGLLASLTEGEKKPVRPGVLLALPTVLPGSRDLPAHPLSVPIAAGHRRQWARTSVTQPDGPLSKRCDPSSQSFFV